MARLTKLAVVLIAALSFSVSEPSKSEAGLIPWMWDTMFGPVGSVRARRDYAIASRVNARQGIYPGNSPMMASYGGYSQTMVSYAPTASGYGGSCGCNQSTYYQPATSYDTYYGYSNSGYSNYGYSGNCCSGGCCPTGGCSTCVGNCSANCSNCSVGTSGSSTSRYPSPTPDSNYNRDNNQNHSTYGNGNSNSVRELEDRIRRLEYDSKQHSDFLEKKHQNEFQLDRYKPTGQYEGERVLPRGGNSNRKINDTINSDYQPPRKSKYPVEEEDPQERDKPNLSTPVEINPPGTKTDEAKPQEADVQSRRPIGGLTARAVAPRERIQSTASKTSPAKVVATKPKKNSTKIVLDSTLSGDVARH